MSGADVAGRRERRGRARERGSIRFFLTSGLFLNALLAVGAVAAWPIYRSSAFIVMVCAALVLGNLIAAVGALRRWSPWGVALAALGAYLIGGVPLAAPGALVSVEAARQGALGVLAAPVTGWKDLLTLELPLGQYQATLAPTYLLLLAAATLSLSLGWRARTLWVLATPAALEPTVFGVLFGSSVLSPTTTVGSLALTGPRELAVGASALVLALGYSVWHTLYDRRRAVRAAEMASGVRSVGRRGTAVVGRIAIGAAMLAVAVGVGTVAAPFAVAGDPRDVLRANVDPTLEIARQPSPLMQYRLFHSDRYVDDVLFRVEGAEGADRVRLATLSFYDGRVARVIDPLADGDDQATAFVRVPSTVPAASGTTPVTATITIGAYRDVWVPLVGSLTAIDFEGPARTTLADGFFYNAATRTGVQVSTPGLTEGVRFVERGVIDPAPPAVGTLTPPRDAPSLDPAIVPESLTDWIRAQDSPTGGAGLAELIDRLRARGFLSHALTVDAADPPLWMQQLDGYAFEPSRAGHSTDRIDQLFTALLEKQADVGGDDDAALVAAVGDDEQFAVAAAMIADQLGFPARIVLGAHLVSAGSTAVPACEDGQCRGGNLTAWIEVQGVSGAWVPLDVTPQYANTLAPQLEQRRDPQNPTDLDREDAQSVPPAEANPADPGQGEDDAAAEGADLSALWAALRVGGISLLVVLILVGPFLAIVLLKTLRRRGRRRSPDAVDRVVGGWEEYVDAAVDHGLDAPRTATRLELATVFAADDPDRRGVTLATIADRSVFDETPPTPDEGTHFWRIVDAERERLAAARGRWGAFLARLSLRSLTRRTTAPARRPRTTKDTRPRR